MNEKRYIGRCHWGINSNTPCKLLWKPKTQRSRPLVLKGQARSVVTCWVCEGCCCVCALVVFGVQRKILPSDSPAQTVRRRWNPAGGDSESLQQLVVKEGKTREKDESLTAKASSALWLSVVSSGLSTGVWRVNLLSNWLTSSSDCCSSTTQAEDEEVSVLINESPCIQTSGWSFCPSGVKNTINQQYRTALKCCFNPLGGRFNSNVNLFIIIRKRFTIMLSRWFCLEGHIPGAACRAAPPSSEAGRPSWCAWRTDVSAEDKQSTRHYAHHSDQAPERSKVRGGTWMSAQSVLLEPSRWDGFFFRSYSGETRESVAPCGDAACCSVGTFLMRSLASTVKYGGRLSLHFRILSMVFFLFSAVNGGCGGGDQRRIPGKWRAPCVLVFLLWPTWLTDPVIMSYIRAPRLHQSTALLWPNLVRISGALFTFTHQGKKKHQIQFDRQMCECL